MSEQQKDYERIEDEKFEIIRFSCPWRHTPKIKGSVFCLATTELCAKADCGVWHIAKAMMMIRTALILILLMASDLDCAFVVHDPEPFVICEMGQIWVMDLGSEYPYTHRR
jgi:hypothetical protein